MNISDLVIQIETYCLEDGSIWYRMGNIFKNEWHQWVKYED